MTAFQNINKFKWKETQLESEKQIIGEIWFCVTCAKVISIKSEGSNGFLKRIFNFGKNIGFYRKK